MRRITLLLVTFAVTTVSTHSNLSAVKLVQDIFSDCLQNFRIVGCVQPKALSWFNQAMGSNVVRITDDLALVKKNNANIEERSDMENDIFENFEDVLQSYDVVAKLPSALRADGPFGMYVPRTFQPSEVTVPLAATGRSSKLVKRVIFPFLLGLKFKTAVLVPLALTLIALKTWKALTLGLLSLVLSGAIAIFSKFVAPKPTYEVVHYPHLDNHVDYHHVDVIPAPVVPAPLVPAPAVHYGHPVYAGRALNGAQEMAYNLYLN